jgi:hypothetical protein
VIDGGGGFVCFLKRFSCFRPIDVGNEIGFLAIC